MGISTTWSTAKAHSPRPGALLPGRVLPGPVHVRVPQRDVALAVEPGVRGQVLLGRELGDAVGRDRLELRRFGGGPVTLAVDRSPSGGEDDLRAVLPCGLE